MEGSSSLCLTPARSGSVSSNQQDVPFSIETYRAAFPVAFKAILKSYISRYSEGMPVELADELVSDRPSCSKVNGLDSTNAFAVGKFGKDSLRFGGTPKTSRKPPNDNLIDMSQYYVQSPTVSNNQTSGPDQTSSSDGLFGAALTEEGVALVEQLTDQLQTDAALNQEGIFRKSGRTERQNRLRQELCTGCTIAMKDYTTDDIATVLKIYLMELPETILSEKHRPIYVQLCDFQTQAQISKDQARRINCKKVNLIRCLISLLPPKNRTVLSLLLNLLYQISQNEERTLMSTTALATIFAPIFLCPPSMNSNDPMEYAKKAIPLVELMIRYSNRLFGLPKPILNDFELDFKARRRLQLDHHCSTLGGRLPSQTQLTPEGRNPLNPGDGQDVNSSISFVNRQKSLEDHNTEINTATELAKLYATIQMMPPSKEKEKRIKKFKEHNRQQNGLTPQEVKHKSRVNKFSNIFKPKLILTGGTPPNLPDKHANRRENVIIGEHGRCRSKAVGGAGDALISENQRRPFGGLLLPSDQNNSTPRSAFSFEDLLDKDSEIPSTDWSVSYSNGCGVGGMSSSSGSSNATGQLLAGGGDLMTSHLAGSPGFPLANSTMTGRMTNQQQALLSRSLDLTSVEAGVDGEDEEEVAMMSGDDDEDVTLPSIENLLLHDGPADVVDGSMNKKKTDDENDPLLANTTAAGPSCSPLASSGLVEKYLTTVESEHGPIDDPNTKKYYLDDTVRSCYVTHL